MTLADGTDDAAGWTISPATAKEGETVTVQYNGTKKVKSIKAVKKAATVTSYTLAESMVGMVVGTDGKAYAMADKDNLPTGVTAAGMVAYKEGSNGLVIALADEANKRDWNTACGESGAVAHTPAIAGYTWKLPSLTDWKNMFKAIGGSDEYNALNTVLAMVGGDSSQLLYNVNYWSSTEIGSNYAYQLFLSGEQVWYSHDGKYYQYLIRAVLAF